MGLNGTVKGRKHCHHAGGMLHVNIKNGQHNHKTIVAADIVLCTCMQHRNVFKQISTLHVLCSDVCCIAEIFLQRPIINRSVLDLACESTFWLIPSLLQCLSWLWMLSVLSSKSCENPFLSVESLVITELSVKFAKLQNSEYEITWRAQRVVNPLLATC